VNWKRTIWVAALMFALAPAAKATSLPINTVGIVPSSQSLASLGALQSTQTLPFTVANAATGTVATGNLINQVYLNAAGLAFTYQISPNNASSIAAVTRLTMLNFTGFTTDVGFVSPTTGVLPVFADRNSGSTVGFDLAAPGVSPGQSSAILVIQTNAPRFDNTGSTNVIDGGVGTVLSFRPLAVVPEPATLVLAGVGLPLASLLGYARRRRSQPA
jgi:hypothetical protein